MQLTVKTAVVVAVACVRLAAVATTKTKGVIPTLTTAERMTLKRMVYN